MRMEMLREFVAGRHPEFADGKLCETVETYEDLIRRMEAHDGELVLLSVVRKEGTLPMFPTGRNTAPDHVFIGVIGTPADGPHEAYPFPLGDGQMKTTLDTPFTMKAVDDRRADSDFDEMLTCYMEWLATGRHDHLAFTLRIGSAETVRHFESDRSPSPAILISAADELRCPIPRSRAFARRCDEARHGIFERFHAFSGDIRGLCALLKEARLLGVAERISDMLLRQLDLMPEGT